MILKLAGGLIQRCKIGQNLDKDTQLSDLKVAIEILNSRIDRLEKEKKHNDKKISSELSAFYDVRFQLIHEYQSINRLSLLFRTDGWIFIGYGSELIELC